MSVPESLLISIEESVALLSSLSSSSLTFASSSSPVLSTVRSIHSLLRTHSSHSHHAVAPSSQPPAEQFVFAFTSLFQWLLQTQAFAQSLSLLSLLPLSPPPSSSPSYSSSASLASLRADCLRRLVLVLSQSSSISLLTSLPFRPSQPQVTRILSQQAQHAEIDFSAPAPAVAATPSSPPRYHDILFAYLMARRDWAEAARSMYRHAQRLQAEGDMRQPQAVSLLVFALERVYNALSMLEDGVVAVEDANGGALLLDMRHMRQQLQAAIAHIDLLTAPAASVSAAAAFSLSPSSPSSLILPLLERGLLDTAVSLASSLQVVLERQQAFLEIVQHIVRLLSASLSSSALAPPLQLEDHSVVLPARCSFSPPSAADSLLQLLRVLLSEHDDSTFYLRAACLSQLLHSPLALSIPHWLLSHHHVGVAVYRGVDRPQAEEDEEEEEEEGSRRRQREAASNCLSAVLRVLLKENRLDLAVEAAVRWLQEETDQEAEAGQPAAAVKRVKADVNAAVQGRVEWNAVEDLVRRLRQAKATPGLGEAAAALISRLHSQLQEAIRG